MMRPFVLALALMGMLVRASVFDTDDSDQESVEEAEYLQALARRGVFDCKKHAESCSGFPKCCGTLQCFWENGYSVTKSGVCVPCVDRSLKCQRDGQCCEPLVCQKDDIYSIDGICDVKRPQAATCYRDSQCQSNECQVSWKDKLTGKTGRCVNKSRRYLDEGSEFGYDESQT